MSEAVYDLEIFDEIKMGCHHNFFSSDANLIKDEDCNMYELEIDENLGYSKGRDKILNKDNFLFCIELDVSECLLFWVIKNAVSIQWDIYSDWKIKVSDLVKINEFIHSLSDMGDEEVKTAIKGAYFDVFKDIQTIKEFLKNVAGFFDKSIKNNTPIIIDAV